MLGEIPTFRATCDLCRIKEILRNDSYDTALPANWHSLEVPGTDDECLNLWCGKKEYDSFEASYSSGIQSFSLILCDRCHERKSKELRGGK